MLKPKMMLVPALLFGIGAPLWLTLGPSLAVSSADECKANPGPAAGHWYRLNRADGRRCWVQGKGAKAHSVAPQKQERRARHLRTQHASIESDLGTGQTTPAQVTPAPATSVPKILASSGTLSGDRNLRFTDFTVPWPSLPISPAPEARESSATSSYAKNHVAADSPAPTRSMPRAEGQRAQPIEVPSEAAFSPTVFGGALAIALMLSAAIVTFARRFTKQDQTRQAAGWLEAYHQLRGDLTETTERRSEPISRPVRFIPKRATPAQPTGFEAGLEQLVRDLRRAEMEAEPRHKLEQGDPHQQQFFPQRLLSA